MEDDRRRGVIVQETQVPRPKDGGFQASLFRLRAMLGWVGGFSFSAVVGELGEERASQARQGPRRRRPELQRWEAGLSR